MTIDQFEQRVMGGCPVFTASQREAAAFLDTLGYRFLYNYGFQNCESIAENEGWERPLVFIERTFRRRG